MQHIYDLGKPHCIDCTISVTIIICNDFQNTCTPEPPQRFGRSVFFALLCSIERKADIALNFLRKSLQVLST